MKLTPEQVQQFEEDGFSLFPELFSSKEIQVLLDDIFNLGPWDLSTGYGFPLQERHPLVQEAFDKVLNLGRLHNIAVGVSPLNAQEAKDLLSRGARFFEAVSIETYLAAQLADYRTSCQTE